MVADANVQEQVDDVLAGFGLDDVQAAFADAAERPVREEREYFIARTQDKIAGMIGQAVFTGNAVEIAPHAREGKGEPAYVTIRPFSLARVDGSVQVSYAVGSPALALSLIGSARVKNPRFKAPQNAR